MFREVSQPISFNTSMKHFGRGIFINFILHFNVDFNFKL